MKSFYISIILLSLVACAKPKAQDDTYSEPFYERSILNRMLISLGGLPAVESAMANDRMLALLKAKNMDAKSIEGKCYSQKAFKEVSNCISKELVNIKTMPRNRSLYQQYELQAKILAKKVGKGVISNEEARLKLSALRINLEDEDQNRLSDAIKAEKTYINQQALSQSLSDTNNNRNSGSNLNNSTFTQCNAVGGGILNCHSF